MVFMVLINGVLFCLKFMENGVLLSKITLTVAVIGSNVRNAVVVF